MKTEAEIKYALLEWIKNAAKKKTAEITAQTKILEDRVITSMQIVEFIMVIESLLGHPIDMKTIGPGSFRTLDDIYETFFR